MSPPDAAARLPPKHGCDPLNQDEASAPTHSTPLRAPPTSPWLRPSTGLKAVGLICLVALVLYRFDLDEVRSQWRGASPDVLLGLCLCFVSSMSLRVLKWGWQLRWVGLGFSWLPLTRNYLIGVLLGVLTPMRVGEMYRLAAVDFGDAALKQRSLAVASVVLEKFYELSVILSLVTVGLVFSLELPALGALVGLGTLAALAFELFSLPPPSWAKAVVPERLWQLLAVPMLRARDGLTLSQRLRLMAVTLAAHLINLVGGLAIFNMFGEMPASDFFFRMPVIALVNAVPVTISGIGLRELGAMELFGPLGYSPSAAATSATLLFVAINGIPLLALGPVLLVELLMGGPKAEPRS